MQTKPKTIGRYAPSPTGDLHLGNLRTALLAWLHARLQNGRFLLRMEDLDTPRVVTGSAEKLLRDLEWLGIDWDGEVIYQSDRLESYQSVLDSLTQQNLVYPCYCSRKDIQQAASAPHGQLGVYPGTCAHLSAQQRKENQVNKNPAIRLRVSDALQETCGDFVVKRADNLFAYQLAVVVDDLEQGVTEVVRGADLQSSTARQLYLAQLLAPESTPIRYLHAPLLYDQSGQRMSKRDGSQSGEEWRNKGGSADSLVTHLAHGLDLISSLEPVSAQTLLSSLTLEQLEKCFV